MTDKEKAEVKAVIEALLEIAALAMPDTYYATDSRIRKALNFMRRLDRGR